MTSTFETPDTKTGPGIVRRLWWRTNQPARLAIMCLGVLTTLATTGAVAFTGDDQSRHPGDTGPEAAMHRGDTFEATVHTVSDVDLFEGVEPATGLFFQARVAGVRRVEDCWLAESRTTAQNLLRGKNVRLIVKKDAMSASDRMAVDVRLPDGTDYARTIVHEGVASADVSTRGELASVEAAAREERRGVWASACAPGKVTASSEPSSSEPAPTTTTTAAATPESSAQPPPPPRVTSIPSSRPSDDPWIDVRLGKVCFVEGARKTAPNGEEMVCARNGRNQLRWRRAD